MRPSEVHARAQSFGSLKTEEKTNASAGSDRPASGSRETLSVDSRGRFPPVANTDDPGSPGNVHWPGQSPGRQEHGTTRA